MVKKSKVFIVLSLISLVFAIPVYSDVIAPTHMCMKPFKPYQFNNQWELDNFNDQVSSYQTCIEDFIDEQKRESNNHLQAAEYAIEDWNRFVEFELN